MRKKVVAGNWKMNTNIEEGIQLANDVNILVTEQGNSDVEVIIAPPFTHISEATKQVDSNKISVAAQNCATKDSGAFTGEISANMIKSIGAKYIIIGHSERRAYYNETDEILLEKVKMVLSKSLKPIFCCGEVLEQRESNDHFNVITSQIENTLFNISEDEMKNIVIAYEPVWAIGTGKTASPEQAQEMHNHIRTIIKEKFGNDIAENISILYGGSCKPSNAKEIFSKPDVDGGLIGGAALKAEDFIQIINAF
jgi:triosephosphate isomerase